MATRTAKLRVELDGEKEYKQAIQELNNGNKVLNSEMKLLQATYQGNEKSMEALAAKSDLLQRQLQQQKDKVLTLQNAVKNAEREYGEADKRTASWIIQLNNAQREEIELERALNSTNKEIEQQGDAMEETTEKTGGLGDQLDTITGKLGIHLPDAAQKALNGMNGFSLGTVTAMATAAAGVAALYKGITALHEITLEQAAKADELLTRSAQTGLSTTLLQGLDYAQNFLDFNGIDASLQRLIDSMDKARDGAERQQEAFNLLGVAVTDANGELRDSWDVFQDVIDALGRVENPTERDAAAADLLGKSYRELKPLIDAGTGALTDYVNEAIESGYVMREDQVEALGKVDDAAQKNEAAWENLKNEIAYNFSPISKSALETLATAADTAARWLEDSGLYDKFTNLTGAVGDLVDKGVEWIDTYLPDWDMKLSDFISPFSALSNFINQIKIAYETIELLRTSFQLWQAEERAAAQEIEAQIPDNPTVKTPTNLVDPSEVSDAVVSTVNSRLEEYMSKLEVKPVVVKETIVTDLRTYAGYNASGTDNWRGGLTWVGERGPELVELPQGAKIHPAQESQQIAAASVDTGRMEALLERNVALLERISGEFSGLRVKERMAV